MSGELQIADAQGNKALTRLLAEIDGFLTKKGGA